MKKRSDWSKLKINTLIKQISGGTKMAPSSIYIHIPFCVKKCGYCDFLSFSKSEEIFEEYIIAVLRELQEKKEELSEHKIQTIFIGGGTPSMLPPKMLGKIMSFLMDHCNLADNIEITMEVNPGTMEISKLREWKSMEINRLSIGLQAWQNRLLKVLGRIHTCEEFIKNYVQARDAGFQNINLDIMFALPSQTLNDWEETLENVLKLRPQHVSAYSLIYEDGTPFMEKLRAGKLEETSEELDRTMYALAKKMMWDKGYQQYEISNFSLPGFESQHNCVYWRDEEYWGIGLGSHSYVNGIRYANTRDLKKYLASHGKREAITEQIEKLSLETQMAEFMFMGLRLTQGVEKDRFYQRFGEEMLHVYEKEISQLIEEGLLDYRKDRICLTERGIDISNYVFEKFLL